MKSSHRLIRFVHALDRGLAGMTPYTLQAPSTTRRLAADWMIASRAMLERDIKSVAIRAVRVCEGYNGPDMSGQQRILETQLKKQNQAIHELRIVTTITARDNPFECFPLFWPKAAPKQAADTIVQISREQFHIAVETAALSVQTSLRSAELMLITAGNHMRATQPRIFDRGSFEYMAMQELSVDVYRLPLISAVLKTYRPKGPRPS